MHLYTDEGNIDTTANHPFYVIGKGWVAAGDLAVGDEVYNLDGTTSTILGSEIEVLDEPVLVYNLEVEDFHSYFVGCVPVLVHNTCGNDVDLLIRDESGRVHGDLPSIGDLKNFSSEDLEFMINELENSVRQRIGNNIIHGPHKRHGERQAQEQQLIHSIKKLLGM